MFWSYDTRTYSDCRPCIVLSVLPHVKHFKAVYSVKTKTKANLSTKHRLNYWNRCKQRCKRRLMLEIDALTLNFNHTTVFAHVVLACDWPTPHMCAKSENTAMTTDLMLISYYKCYIHYRNMLRLCFGAMTHALIVIVGLA